MTPTLREIIERLRNRHVARLLHHLGGDAVPGYLQAAIKTAFTYFLQDVLEAIEKDGQEDKRC